MSDDDARAPRSDIGRDALPSAAPTTEIELKLTVSEAELARLGRLSLIGQCLRGRARTLRLHSVYYDTPDCDLQRDGLALRLRRSGARWMQTLKGEGQVQGGLHLRQERDTPVPAQILNYQALIAAGASHVFSDAALRASLQPVFVTDFRRTVRELEVAAGTRVELAADTGTITTGTASAPISELELELKEGAPEALLDFAISLLREVPFRLEPATKAQRGYALMAGKQAAPIKADAPALRPELSVTDAFQAIAFSCLGHLQANERGLLESDDEEYLHQARVALRRLRSAFSVFGRAFPRSALEELVGEIRWLGSYLGPARDWDVFATETLPAMAIAFPGDLGLHELLEHTAAMRADAVRGARDAIASPRYTLLLLNLIGSFHRKPWVNIPDPLAAGKREQPLLGFCAEVLGRRHRKVAKHGRNLAELDMAGLHALRIEVKKLRYAAEFFSTLYDKKAVRAYALALTRLQSLLGSLNDAATVERLSEPLRDQADTADPCYAEAVGLVRGWAGAAARARLSQLPAAWDAFKSVKKFW